MIFFIAGFESVTSVMTFMAYELAINPDIQERLRDEIEATQTECAGKLTFECLMKMKYMDMVVSGIIYKKGCTIILHTGRSISILLNSWL